MRVTCRRDGCWNAVLSWLSDWCQPTCQFADLDDAGVDMRMKTRDVPGPRYDRLRSHAGAEDWELVRDHELKFKRSEYVAAGGTLPLNTGGLIPGDAVPVLISPGRFVPSHTTERYRFWLDELNPPAPKPLPRTRRPLFAGLIRRLFP